MLAMIFALIFGPPVFGAICAGMLAMLIKMSQLNFIDRSPDNWSFDEMVQFLAFVNNLMAIDQGHDMDLQSVERMMFAGEDALEDQYESVAERAFRRMLAAHLTEKLGAWRAIMIMAKLTGPQLQSLVIEDHE